jgi:hypothetical protein
MEPIEERVAILERRIAELTELINLLLTLKQKKVDISNFTCVPIHLDGNR